MIISGNGKFLFCFDIVNYKFINLIFNNGSQNIGKCNDRLLRVHTRWFWHGRKEQAEQDRVLVPVAWAAPGWAARKIQS